MADFELEQLKTLFQNLADRLSNTKGDADTVARLALLDRSLKNIADKIGAHDSKAVIDSRGLAAKFSKEFLDELRRIAPQDAGPTSGGGRSMGGAGAGQGMLNIDLEKQTGFVGKLKGLAKGVAETRDSIGSFANKVAGATDRVRTMDGSFGSMTTAMGLTGAAATTFAKIMDSNVSAYRGVQGSAEGSITSFEQMHQAMSTSITTAGEFSDAMNKGSDGVRALGGMEWAKFNKGFRDATRETGFYAMSLGQIRDAQSSYLDILKNQGSLFDLKQDDLVAGLNSLIKINDKMAGIMGKTREDQLKGMADQSRDADFQTFMKSRGMDSQPVDALMNAIKQMDPKFEGALKDLAISNGAITPQNAGVMAPLGGTELGQTLIDIAQKINAGTMTEDEMKKSMAALQDAAKTIPDSMKEQMAILGRIGGNEDFTAINRFVMGLNGTKNVNAVPDADKKVGGAGEKAAMGAEEAMKSVAANMDAALNRVFDTALKEYGVTIMDSNKAIVEWSDNLRKSISGMDSLTGAMALLGGASGTGLVIAGIAGFTTALSVASGKLLVGGGKMLAKMAMDGTKATASAAAEGARRTGSIFSSAAKSADTVGDAAKAAGTAAEAAAQAATKAGSAVGDVAADAAKGLSAAEPAWVKAMKTDAPTVPTPATPAPATNVPVEPIKPGGAAGGVAEGAADAAQAAGRGSSALSAAAKAAKFAAKFGTPLNVLLQGAQTYGEITDLNAKHDSGEMDDATFKKEFSKSLAKALGGVGGGILGAELGAGIGAAGGTLVAPGAGTLVGGIGGGVMGGIGGMFAGEKMAEALTDSVFGLINPSNNAQPATAGAPAAGGTGTPSTAMPTGTNTVRDAAVPVEVPLTARDIKQPFDNLQTALVAQMEQSNKLLEAIRDLIRTGNENVKDGTVGNVQGLADLTRALDEIRSGQRIQSIY